MWWRGLEWLLLWMSEALAQSSTERSYLDRGSFIDPNGND